jgi:1-deoxy-D-xylulose-5-phosphate reductoisomerase
MTDIAAAAELKLRTRDLPVRIYSGHDGICQMISDTDADLAVNSIIGTAGLLPTLAVIDSGKDLALANKESLVIAGKIVMDRARENNVRVTPVDSEHCAIAQCLRCGSENEIKSLIITASGGPFFGKKRDELLEITREQALAHPTWKMGAKITIDSATLMNKGFEVIEASHLFGVPGEKIDVIVHRESIIHSMVEFCDNSVIAQLSVPDMRLCVQYAIEMPYRYEAVIPKLNLASIGSMSFADPDLDTFIPLKLARESLQLGGAASAVLHSANEVAVEQFLKEKIRFIDIFDTLEYVCGEMKSASECVTLDSTLESVNIAASMAKEYLSRK